MHHPICGQKNSDHLKPSKIISSVYDQNRKESPNLERPSTAAAAVKLSSIDKQIRRENKDKERKGLLKS